MQHLDRILKREETLLNLFLTSRNKDLVPANQAVILARKALATSSPPDFRPFYAPCAAVHPWIEPCMHVPLPRFFTVFKWAFQIHGALHFVPMMLFKRHAFFKSPSHMLGCAKWATIRSSAFLGAFIAIYQSMYFHFTPSMSSQYLFVAWICSKHYNRLLSSQIVVKVPRRVLDLFASNYSYALGGFLGALSLFVEEKRTRRACYVRSAEGPGECLFDGKRQGLGLSSRAFWRDACKCRFEPDIRTDRD
jgi:hypothetical protein